jgi:hypothetical protein
VHLVRAVSFYRSKFLDCLRGAVAHSYRNVDLLWDNVITRPWGTQKCLTADPWSLSAGHEPTAGADHEEIDERAALCCAKKGGQGQGQARARQIGHSGGARARSRNGAAVCGPAFNDAPSYRVAEAPIGREVQRELLSTIVPNEIERGDAVVIAGDSFAIDDVRRIYNYRKAES